MHTSGASSIEILSPYHASTAVFWPLQTFTAGREINWAGLPVCVQSSGPEAAALIQRIGEGMGVRLIESTSEERLKYHLAAVFVSNFVNHLYALADIWCRENLLEPEHLKPLILETAKKVQELSAPEAQTGPAKRHDLASMEKHLALLNDHPALQQVYALLSEQIMNRYQFLLKP
jgi:predicted short-subunit dehydrogenase-like oxidoreductase (DUF2520 family)